MAVDPGADSGSMAVGPGKCAPSSIACGPLEGGGSAVGPRGGAHGAPGMRGAVGPSMPGMMAPGMPSMPGMMAPGGGQNLKPGIISNRLEVLDHPEPSDSGEGSCGLLLPGRNASDWWVLLIGIEART